MRSIAHTSNALEDAFLQFVSLYCILKIRNDDGSEVKINSGGVCLAFLSQ